jgi:excisionase family DNA binding protein
MVITIIRNVLTMIVNRIAQPSSDMYTIPEAAKLMGITRQRLHLLVQHGRVRAYRIGRVWMIPCDAIGHILPAGRPAGRPRKHKR